MHILYLLNRIRAKKKDFFYLHHSFKLSIASFRRLSPVLRSSSLKAYDNLINPGLQKTSPGTNAIK